MNNTYKYLIVKEAILKEIKEGRLSPGEKLKSEEEYAQEYQVSLITIRKALTELTTDGYITRIRKKEPLSTMLRPNLHLLPAI